MAKKWIKSGKADTKEAAEAPEQKAGDSKKDETGTKKKTPKQVRGMFYGSKE